MHRQVALLFMVVLCLSGCDKVREESSDITSYIKGIKKTKVTLYSEDFTKIVKEWEGKYREILCPKVTVSFINEHGQKIIVCGNAVIEQF